MEQPRAPTNPKYINIQKKIQSLKNRTETALAAKTFTDLYNLIRGGSQPDIPTLRNRVLTILDQNNVAYWHLLDQII